MKRRIAGLAASNFLAPLLQFAASPVLTRIYGPEPMGGFAVIYSAAALLALIFTGQVHQALVSEDEAGNAEALYQEVLLTALLVYGLCCLAVFLVFTHSHPPFLILTLSFLTALGQIYTYCLSRHRRLRTISLLLLVRAIAIIGTQIVFGNFSATKESLLLAVICSEACFILGAAFSLSVRDLPSNARSIRERFRFSRVMRHRNYPLRYLPSQLVSLGTNFAPLALASHVGATGSAGLFAFSLRLVQAPAASISNAVRMTFWQPNSDYADTYKAARTITRLGQPFVTLCGVVAFVLPESLYVFMFGPNWGGISAMLGSVFLWVGSSVITQFATEILKHTGRQGVILRTEIVGSLFKCAFLGTLFLDISTTLAMASFCLAGFAFNIFSANYYLRVAASGIRNG